MASPDTIAARLSQGLTGRYRVERELGRGGMAIVYLALDEKHSRPVAIKVLRPEISSAIGATRFLREIQIAAQLNHPHILPLYDSGESDSLLYYVMPYVTGESLRERLAREHQMPLHDAVQIGAEVASALQYAHLRDIVHRDIKPENILLSEGYALVADFGIARAITAAEDSGPVTTAGITVGTPLYMSPEQAMAEAVDGRSDQYSLGCVLYEMLTGRPPFGGTTAQAILAKHTLDPVPSIRAVRADVPESLEQVISISLAKEPAERHAAAETLEAALRGSITGDVITRRVARAEPPQRRRRRRAALLASFTVLLSVGVVTMARRPRAPAPGPASSSVAVIPFTNAGEVGKPDYYVDGFTEDLIGALRRIPGLRVAPATSSYRFARTARTPKELGQRLGASYLIGGNVLRQGSRVKVHSYLIQTATGDTILPSSYDTLDRGSLEVQTEIARGIAQQLRVNLSAATAASLARRPTQNPVAYDLYLQGRAADEQRTFSSLQRSIQLFQAAIKADTGFALAYAGLADAYGFMAAFQYAPPRDFFPQSRAAGNEAVARDSLLPEAYASLGFVALFYDWNIPDAFRQLDEALRLDSTLTRAHLFRSHAFITQHQPDSAVAEMRAAQALEPFSLIVGTRLMTALYFAGKHEEAAREGERVLAGDSTYALVVPDLARVYLLMDRCADALRITSRPMTNFYEGVRTLAGIAYARCGQPERARQVLKELDARRRAGTYVEHYDYAAIYASLGDLDNAFREFNLAVDDREFFLFSVTWDPMWVFLRPDPRFAALTSRISLNSKE
ncbi:MAG TPA: protein kinase [Gemmatimonadales bacterium]|nr:protein kinase [Gemmatimonadales bacterium]